MDVLDGNVMDRGLKFLLGSPQLVRESQHRMATGVFFGVRGLDIKSEIGTLNRTIYKFRNNTLRRRGGVVEGGIESLGRMEQKHKFGHSLVTGCHFWSEHLLFTLACRVTLVSGSLKLTVAG